MLLAKVPDGVVLFVMQWYQRGCARGEDSLYSSSGICPQIEEVFSSWGPICDTETRRTVANVGCYVFSHGFVALCTHQAGSREAVALAAQVGKGCSLPQRTATLEASSMCLMLKVWGWPVLPALAWTASSSFVKQGWSSLAKLLWGDEMLPWLKFGFKWEFILGIFLLFLVNFSCKEQVGIICLNLN